MLSMNKKILYVDINWQQKTRLRSREMLNQIIFKQKSQENHVFEEKI